MSTRLLFFAPLQSVVTRLSPNISFRDPIKNPMLNLVRGLLHLEITNSTVRYNTLSFSIADFQTFRLFRDSRLL